MNKYGLTEREIETVLGMAQNSLNVTNTAISTYYSRNTVLYHLDCITERCGLNPRNFFDLVELVRSLQPELLGPEGELSSEAQTVMRHLPRTEMLTQLAEEAVELAHAALKLRRALSPTNPTPVTQERALEGLVGELADVQNCVTLVKNCFDIPQTKVVVICGEKMERWARRLAGEE